MKILFDSDIVINILKKEKDFIEKFLHMNSEGVKFFYNSIISAEIYAGAYEKELAYIKELFSHFACIELDCQIGEVAGKYANKYKKSHHNISLEDYLIAATAKYHGLSLWTNNKKHYPMNDIHIL